jgi:FkbM family methyltransferase
MIKKLIQKSLGLFGYYLRSTQHFGDSYWLDITTILPNSPTKTHLIFDVGAHHGETAQAARRYYPNSKIHCFEPDPESLEILRSSTEKMIDVTIHPVALGANLGKSQFHRNNESMTNSLLPTSKDSLHSDYGSLATTNSTIEVQIETIDEVCRLENIEWIDLLKTDCQGYDLMVLRGGEKMISSHQIGLVSCEIIFDHEYDGQDKYHELLGFMDAHGYHFIGFYNMARDSNGRCTFCDAIFRSPEKHSK